MPGPVGFIPLLSPSVAAWFEDGKLSPNNRAANQSEAIELALTTLHTAPRTYTMFNAKLSTLATVVAAALKTCLRESGVAPC